MLGLGHCFFAFAGGPRVRHSSPNPRSVQLRSLAPSEFELFKGRVIDTLTHKYTNLYTEKPDFSIFTPNVVLSDSSGKRIQGLQSYERVFDMLHLIRRTAIHDATITHRMVADPANETTIRVRWSTELSLRGGAVAESLGLATVFNLDGISVYRLDRTGHVYWHSLEDFQLIKDDQAWFPTLTLALDLNLNLNLNPNANSSPSPTLTRLQPSHSPSPNLTLAVTRNPDFNPDEQAQSVTLEAAMRVGLSAASMASAARPPVLQFRAHRVKAADAARAVAPAPRQLAPLTARAPRRAAMPQACAAAAASPAESPMERAARERAQEAQQRRVEACPPAVAWKRGVARSPAS